MPLSRSGDAQAGGSSSQFLFDRPSTSGKLVHWYEHQVGTRPGETQSDWIQLYGLFTVEGVGLGGASVAG